MRPEAVGCLAPGPFLRLECPLTDVYHFFQDVAGPVDPGRTILRKFPLLG